MSQEHVELLARGSAAIDAGELSDETLESVFTPDLQMTNTSTAVTDKTYAGRMGLREWASDFREAFEPGARLELEEVIADGEEFVVSRMRWVGSGARSGAPLVLQWISVAWFRGAKICKIVGYMNRRDALRAVGLER